MICLICSETDAGQMRSTRPKGSVTICQCLYCGHRTGAWPSPETAFRATVCGKCQHSSVRDEAREIAAGMMPWMRPLSFWVSFFGMKPAADELWKAAQEAWDANQKEIIEFNRAHSGARL